MYKQECIAMLLAGGQGTRLGILTRKLAKPAVPFGGKYRIIDFTLSNCSNSGIYTVGVLTQYQPLILNSYIGIGSHWDLDKKRGGVTVLPPYVRHDGGHWYLGTANAVYQNIEFVDQYDPEYVLILSGDHIYKMDYSLMLDYHKEKAADATIAVIEVPWEETHRFGIMNTNLDNAIVEFQEKPREAKNNLASMGVYVFNWQLLRKILIEDEMDKSSDHDFGKNLIPRLLEEGKRIYAYPFRHYWKDVGTIESLWQANMDLLHDQPELDLYEKDWKIYSVNPNQPVQFIAPNAQVKKSLVNEGCQIYGSVENSVLFPGVVVGEGSVIKDSVIMSDTVIGKNVTIERAIIGEECTVEDDCIIGQPGEGQEEITVLGENVVTVKAKNIPGGVEINIENCHEFGCCPNGLTKQEVIS
ncbi:glucose-1-phosphate adenylyltransferase [Anoxynatronum buryatiense]|uniref:Glucose-1-phosphate adenylyltransferase n=1 Tax=Anoxynatronum buryatiense TaxID=489973 RepID=A0AA46AK83_9CLOT|nr:glucose-1-phosphate adenylyltransferase [Anoxynatronum buryatiense]SMP68248.1 glucose-1-phosphate adenylyltransferase [Anoxynatronum buryatiense]